MARLLKTICFAAGSAIYSAVTASAQTSCPSQDIHAFVKAFQEDVKVQQAFTVRPLESIRVNGNAQPEPAPVTEFLDGDKLVFPLIATAEAQAKEKLRSEIRSMGDAHELKLFVPDTGIQVRYLFRKRSDGTCWELYRVADDTF